MKMRTLAAAAVLGATGAVSAWGFAEYSKKPPLFRKKLTPLWSVLARNFPWRLSK